MGLTLEPAPAAEFQRLGDEGWPLAYYLLEPPETVAPPVWQESRLLTPLANPAGERRAALEALILAAFET